MPSITPASWCLWREGITNTYQRAFFPLVSKLDNTLPTAPKHILIYVELDTQ